MGLNRCGPTTKPLLFAINYKKRLQFAKQHIDWTVEQLGNVTWSDGQDSAYSRTMGVQGGNVEHPCPGPISGVTLQQRKTLVLQTKLQNRSSGSTHTTQYRSASNSLLARTAYRTPKTSTLQGDPSRSIFTPSSKRSPYILSPAGRDVTSSSTFKRISSPNRDIKKIPAPLTFHMSPHRQGQGVRRGCCQSSHTYPYKTLFQTIRLTLLGSDFPCL
ncbi:hypothetical protein AVEN_20552-1 [Araneus ventricosus]|uniref:Transposase Tc1-like domain-containing protein n=1 Tax=Araneus ventricosus TaxID=182803 RepID=A0A4Y2JKU6_ARAVE|nr:hypothetical protein AVEN_20552-1 [Araneus ventricosus]